METPNLDFEHMLRLKCISLGLIWLTACSSHGLSHCTQHANI